MSVPRIALASPSRHKNESENKSEHRESDSSTSYEVFRNNTTAVEVVVKDVFKGKKSNDQNNAQLNKLQTELARMKNELQNANKLLVNTKKSFRDIVQIMRKQMDVVNDKEIEAQEQNLKLKLENEKLKISINSKTKLLCRMKKELTTMKRILKFAIKNVCNAPQIIENTVDSDPDYDEFQTDLRKNVRLKSWSKEHDFSDTFDTV